MSALHSYFFVAKPDSWLEPPVLDTHTVNTPSSSKCDYPTAVWQEYRQWWDGIVLLLALYDAMSTYKVHGMHLQFLCYQQHHLWNCAQYRKLHESPV